MSGLGTQADSWVGTGENQSVTGQDIRAVVSDGELGRLAATFGA